MFTITSIEDLKAGQQVYDSYGKKCNSRFLLNYGFAVENNVDHDGLRHNEVGKQREQTRTHARMHARAHARARP